MPDMQMSVYYHLPMGTFFTKPRRGDKIDAHTLVPDARIMNAYKREEQEREREGKKQVEYLWILDTLNYFKITFYKYFKSGVLLWHDRFRGTQSW